MNDVWSVRTQVQGHPSQNNSVLGQKLQQLLGRADIETALLKMEVNLLRFFTPEFLCSNVRLQHGDTDNQLLLSYFKSLFALQMVKGCLTEEEQATGSDSTSRGHSFDSAIKLLLSINELARDNSATVDLIKKPFTRLVQFAFPYLLKVFVHIVAGTQAKG